MRTCNRIRYFLFLDQRILIARIFFHDLYVELGNFHHIGKFPKSGNSYYIGYTNSHCGVFATWVFIWNQEIAIIWVFGICSFSFCVAEQSFTWDMGSFAMWVVIHDWRIPVICLS